MIDTSVIFAQLGKGLRPILIHNSASGNGEVVSVRLTVEAEGQANAKQSNP